MTSWMSKSADGRERAGDRSLAASPLRALKDAGRTSASCHVIAWMSGPMLGAKGGDVKHT